MTIDVRTTPRMMMHRRLVGALMGFAICALAGCTSVGTLTPAAQADLQTALNDACPILASAQPILAGASKQVKSAANVLALACPPNPPPANAFVAAEDIVAAYEIVAAFVHKKG